MALVVWFTMGLAIWHFTVFLPDRFWQGIIGALLGSTTGAIVVGAIVEIAFGSGLGTTNVGTALVAVPGALLGIAAVYWLGIRQEHLRQQA